LEEPSRERSHSRQHFKLDVLRNKGMQHQDTKAVQSSKKSHFVIHR
jgi:hypothetical protein